MRILFIILVSLTLSGCVPSSPQPPKTQLQIRQFQTREYDTGNIRVVMKAILNVLQDDGFIVKNAVTDLGLLSATKEVDIEDRGEAFFSLLFQGDNARWSKNSIVEATANVSEFGKRRTRVRMNFQMKVMDNRGAVVNVHTVDDETFYQDFFSKVDKGVFLERGNI